VTPVGLAPAQVHSQSLEPASMERWARDMDRYTDAVAALKKDEAQFNSFIRSSFSEEAHILLRSNPSQPGTISALSAWSSTLAPAASALHKALCPWPGSLSQLKDELLNQHIKVSAMFDTESTGSMISSWSPSSTLYQISTFPIPGMKSLPRTPPTPSPTSSALSRRCSTLAATRKRCLTTQSRPLLQLDRPPLPPSHRQLPLQLA